MIECSVSQYFVDRINVLCLGVEWRLFQVKREWNLKYGRRRCLKRWQPSEGLCTGKQRNKMDVTCILRLCPWAYLHWELGILSLFLFPKTNVVSYISDCQSTSLWWVPVGHVTRLSEEHHEILISVSAVEFGAVHVLGALYCGEIWRHTEM